MTMHQGVYNTLFTQFLLVSSMTGMGSLMRFSMAKPITLETTVLFSAMNVVAFTVYYMIIDFFRWVCGKRRHRPTVEYNDLQRAEMDIYKGRPRLHMNDVWVLVYGVGVLFYVINYVYTCMDLVSMQFFSYAIGLVVLHELCTSNYRLCGGENVLYALTAVIALLCILIKGADTQYKHLADVFTGFNYWDIFYGILLPLVCSVVMLNIKLDKKYSFGDVYDLCEFGFPFMFIIGMFTLIAWKIYSPDRGLPLLNPQHIGVTVAFTPFSMVVLYVATVDCVMKGHAIDVLISLGLSSGILDMVDNSRNQINLVGMILGLLAAAVRVGTFMVKQEAPKESKKPMHVIDDLEDHIPPSESMDDIE